MKNILALILMLSLLAACQTTNARNGAGLGALTGATVGALTFKNKISGAAIGAGAGLLVGYIVGNEMDKTDSAQVTHALESAPSGKSVAWTNPDTHTHYRAIPEPPRRRRDGRITRNVTIEARMPNGEYETVHAKAYRQPNGTWHLIQ